MGATGRSNPPGGSLPGGPAFCFNPSWVPPAGLIILAALVAVGLILVFQSLMGATGRSNHHCAGNLPHLPLVSIPHGCHRPV